MSEGDRGGDDQAGLKPWIIAAVLISLGIIGTAIVQQRIYYGYAARNASAYSRDADNQIAEKCSHPLTRKHCANEIKQAAHENQRNEYDLYSQESMALWTAIMGAIAVIGVALSGVGVFLIWGTWKQTDEAARNSRETLDSYIWKERAHIKILGAHASQGNALSGIDGFTIALENVGLSPAQVKGVHFQYVTEQKWRPSAMALHAERILIPAAQKESTAHLEAGQIKESWLIGYVEYTTLKSQTFKSYFCFAISWFDMQGYGVNHWIAEQIYPPAMPSDT